MTYTEYGGSRAGAASVGVASAEAVPHNSIRKMLILVNDSDSPIYIHKGDGPAVVNACPRLNANGGSCTIEPDIYGRMWRGPIQAISTGAAKILTWEEDW